MVNQHGEAKSDPEQLAPSLQEPEGHGQRGREAEGHEDQDLAALRRPRAGGRKGWGLAFRLDSPAAPLLE